jgi:hypothetical protein
MLGLRVHRALLVQEFLKLSLIVTRLLALRIVLNSRDFMVWLACLGVLRVVPLAFVGVVIVVALLVVVALGEALVLPILLVGPPCRHVVKIHGSSWAVASKVVVGVLQEKAILEAADDVLVGDVGDGGSHLEEASCVGP